MPKVIVVFVMLGLSYEVLLAQHSVQKSDCPIWFNGLKDIEESLSRNQAGENQDCLLLNAQVLILDKILNTQKILYPNDIKQLIDKIDQFNGDFYSRLVQKTNVGLRKGYADYIDFVFSELNNFEERLKRLIELQLEIDKHKELRGAKSRAFLLYKLDSVYSITSSVVIHKLINPGLVKGKRDKPYFTESEVELLIAKLKEGYEQYILGVFRIMEEAPFQLKKSSYLELVEINRQIGFDRLGFKKNHFSAFLDKTYLNYLKDALDSGFQNTENAIESFNSLLGFTTDPFDRVLTNHPELKSTLENRIPVYYQMVEKAIKVSALDSVSWSNLNAIQEKLDQVKPDLHSSLINSEIGELESAFQGYFKKYDQINSLIPVIKECLQKESIEAVSKLIKSLEELSEETTAINKEIITSKIEDVLIVKGELKDLFKITKNKEFFSESQYHKWLRQLRDGTIKTPVILERIDELLRNE